MWKKFLFLLSSIVLTMSLGVSAYAADFSDTADMSEAIHLTDHGIETRGKGFPSKEWDLSKSDYSGSVDFNIRVVTNYYFTGNDKYTISLNFKRDQVILHKDVSVRLLENGTEVARENFNCNTTYTSKTFTFID